MDKIFINNNLFVDFIKYTENNSNRIVAQKKPLLIEQGLLIYQLIFIISLQRSSAVPFVCCCNRS